MKIQYTEMELLAAFSASISPENFRMKLKQYLPILPRDVLLRCERNRIQKSVSISRKNDISRNSITSTLSEIEKGVVADSYGGRRKKNGRVHFIGIGGCGLSALAMLALKQGYEVSGSDIVWSNFMDGLLKAGAFLYVGHSQLNLDNNSNNGLDLPVAVVVSSAIPQDNVEVVHAKSIGIPVYKRDIWLGKLTEHHNLIAISGSHGKSTTAGMLAYVLNAMGDDPTAVVGAQVPQFVDGNIIFGSGQNFVLEADEYDGCFLGLSPYIVVVTNVEWEHVDVFKDEEAVRTIFKNFLRRIKIGGHLVLCGDSEGAYSLLGDMKQFFKLKFSENVKLIPTTESGTGSYSVTTYGISSHNEWHASCLCPNSRGGIDYKLCYKGRPLADISLQIPGVHNVLNSLAVIATMCAMVGDKGKMSESIQCARLHLNNFKGVSRRFERIGSSGGCQIYDDYAHHPTEVSAVLLAARQRFPLVDILVVFQPHTYSRLAALKNEFATAFVDADHVIITEIYGARETNSWNVSGRDLAAAITGPKSEFVPFLADVVNKLVNQISKNPDHDVVILTLGAGDVTNVGRKLLQELHQKTYFLLIQVKAYYYLLADSSGPGFFFRGP